ncbi:MAG: glycerophosphodiester phosphodiesterase family protein, partial [Candidatus Magasanikbacteria bacterium]|nr:glycerophosphodiester phosphodiesterase family protein [Candidatus Magasanikbacteria bacterium]
MLKIGHRGVAGHEVENTAKSLQKALDLKVDMIELDVHKCASGELVVFHDKRVSRITDSSGSIRKKTLAEIKKLRTSDNQEILTLAEALEIIDGRCNVNIEIKHRGVASALVDVVRQLTEKQKWQLDQFLISSFYHRELGRLKKIHPEIKIGLLYYRNLRSAVK